MSIIIEKKDLKMKKTKLLLSVAALSMMTLTGCDLPGANASLSVPTGGTAISNDKIAASVKNVYSSTLGADGISAELTLNKSTVLVDENVEVESSDDASSTTSTTVTQGVKDASGKLTVKATNLNSTDYTKYAASASLTDVKATVVGLGTNNTDVSLEKGTGAAYLKEGIGYVDFSNTALRTFVSGILSAVGSDETIDNIPNYFKGDIAKLYSAYGPKQANKGGMVSSDFSLPTADEVEAATNQLLTSYDLSAYGINFYSYDDGRVAIGAKIDKTKLLAFASTKITSELSNHYADDELVSKVAEVVSFYNTNITDFSLVGAISTDTNKRINDVAIQLTFNSTAGSKTCSGQITDSDGNVTKNWSDSFYCPTLTCSLDVSATMTYDNITITYPDNLADYKDILTDTVK